MAVSLVKGGNVSLTKEAPSMNVALVGWAGMHALLMVRHLIWMHQYSLLAKTVKCCPIRISYFITTTSPDGAVQHQGDNRTGEGDGDDEQVKIDLTKVAADVKKLVFAVTIHEADSRKQNFGMVSNSFMRVVNNDNGSEIARFDLSEDASTETAMIFGELYRHGAEWKFKAVGQGFAGGPAALATQHGINI